MESINEEYAKMESYGPKDCRVPEENEKIMAQIGVQKPISADGEVMTVSVPVFMKDSKEDLERRVAVLMAPMQKRMVAMNTALLEQEKAAVEHNLAIDKAKVQHQLEIKRMNQEAKKNRKG